MVERFLLWWADLDDDKYSKILLFPIAVFVVLVAGALGMFKDE